MSGITREEVALGYETLSDVARDLATELRRPQPDYTRAADLTQRLAVLVECSTAVSSSWIATALAFGVNHA